MEHIIRRNKNIYNKFLKMQKYKQVKKYIYLDKHIELVKI